MHTFVDFRCPTEAMGLAAISLSALLMWVALGRGKWQIRASVALAILACLLAIKAYQPLVFFSIVGATVILFLAAVRLYAEKTVFRYQFRVAPKNRIHRVDVWTGAIVGMTAGLAINTWAFAVFPAWSWLEWGIVFALVASSILTLSVRFGSRFGLKKISMVKNENHRVSFRMKDALFAVVLIALLCAINSIALDKYPILEWPAFLLAAILMSALTVATALACCAERIRWRVVSLCMMAIIVWAALTFGTPTLDWLVQANPYSLLGPLPWGSMLYAFVIALLMTTLGLATAGLIRLRPSGERSDESSDPVVCRVGVIASLVNTGLFAVCLIPIYASMSKPLASPDPIAESDETYQQIERSVASLLDHNPKELLLSQLRSAGKSENADKVAELYATVRSLGRQPFRAPDPLGAKYDESLIGQKLTPVRSWARCINNESQAKRQVQDFAAAGRGWSDCLHVGHGYSRGGSIVFTLTGVAIEGIGQEGLAKIRHDLPPEQIALILPDLIQIDGQRESWESTRRRSHLAMESELAWQYRLALCAAGHIAGSSENDGQTLASPALEATQDAINRRDAAMRMLITEFAIRLFRNDHQRLPTNLDELVPAYLTVVPLDPFNGQALRYKILETGFDVYSVGPDGIDDGGQFGDMSAIYTAGYDFDLDTLYRNSTAPMGGGGQM